MNYPVVFIIFKRPDTTRQVFARIRNARPPKLYILADGPREDKPVEAALCATARKETENIDWPCVVVRDYSDVNLGCKERVSSGLDFVFSQEEAAIILEDDCLPHPSFFPYCEELLERYRDEPKIGQISGLNVLWGRVKFKSDYYYSKYPLIWGWATWADRWKQWDGDLIDWQNSKDHSALKAWLNFHGEWTFWKRIFDNLCSPDRSWDTWGYPWTYTFFKNKWLTLSASRNLVKNIGMGNNSTHTLAHNPSLCHHSAKYLSR